jgi:hypothetical protein
MASLQTWKWCALLIALPLYACAPLQAPPQPQRACSDCTADARYAVARPHSGNDYPVGYKLQAANAEGRSRPVDRHILSHSNENTNSVRARLAAQFSGVLQ